jgi:hypothetical protein
MFVVLKLTLMGVLFVGAGLTSTLAAAPAGSPEKLRVAPPLLIPLNRTWLVTTVVFVEFTGTVTRTCPALKRMN